MRECPSSSLLDLSRMGNVRGSSTRHIHGIISYGTCRCHCSRDVGSVESIRNYGHSLSEFELEFGIGERTVHALSGFVRMNERFEAVEHRNNRSKGRRVHNKEATSESTKYFKFRLTALHFVSLNEGSRRRNERI